MPPASGVMPEAVSRGFVDGRFRAVPAPALGTSSAPDAWKIPVILVDFPDQPFIYGAPEEWDLALFDSTGATPTGSVDDYYRWVSGNRLRVRGRVVARIRLDQPKTFYAGNSWGLSSSPPQNTYGAVDEALRKCSPAIDWSEFDRDLDGYVDMVWVLHAGLGGEHVVSRQELWSITSRLTQWSSGTVFLTNDFVPGTNTKIRIDAFSVLPERSAFNLGGRSEIGVYCHEFGHALGLPDLYTVAPLSGVFNAGPGNWSLMSTGAYGTDGMSPQYPSHLGAWPMTYLGWSNVVRPVEDGTMVLGPLASGSPILELWFQGEANSEHFLVENRQRLGFDRNLPAEGLVVYQVDDIAIRTAIPSNRVNNGFYPGLRLVEGDGGRELMNGLSRGDAFDPIPGANGLTRWDDATSPSTRSILGNTTHVALSEIQALGDSMSFQLYVRPRGWLPAQIRSEPTYSPVVGRGPAVRALMTADSGLAVVSSELMGGRPQVMLRTRRPDHAWDHPVQLSFSTGSASEPSLAALPGNDLAVVWTDTRHGAGEIYYRFRSRGQWSSEYRLTDLPGQSRGPALGADSFGGIHLAWLYNDGGGSTIQFMYFTYLSPFADPLPVTRSPGLPDSPTLAVAPDGSSYVCWTDRGVTTRTMAYAHFDPDSGIRPSRPLTSSFTGVPSTLNATVDQDGRLHYVWQISNSGGSEVRYQSRGATSTDDTTLMRRGESIQHLGVAVTADGSVHLVMEALRGGVPQILYKERRNDGGGWDIGATEVSRVTDGAATVPAVLPRRSGVVTVLYTGYLGSQAQLVERDRNIQPLSLTAVDADAPHMQASIWNAVPNPVRAGQGLRLWGSDGPGVLEVFDLGGRRVATAQSRRDARGWWAEIRPEVTRDWRSGVYFARVRDRQQSTRIIVLR